MTDDRRTLLRTVLTPAALGLLVSAGLVAPGCKKEDPPPPPLPSATASTEVAAPLELTPEDAGVDAGVDAGKKKVGGGGPATSFKACCAALDQNAKSAPEPTAGYMRLAAGTCHGMAASGRDAAAIRAAVQGMLRGAGMPAACR
ncbi:MAG: acyltransferase [Polyangiaceae bacterium]|nr:acyltransferase [Polyangiaceae bacterium]